MSKREHKNNDGIGAAAKLQRTNDVDKFEITFDQNPSPNIFKLHVICCFEMFEYLPLKDVYAVGQTCRRLNRIAGTYFQENYPAARISLRNEMIFYTSLPRNWPFPISGFAQYVQSIDIDMKNIDLESFRFIEKYCKSLKTINLWSSEDISFKADIIDSIKGRLLTEVETLKLSNIRFDGDLFDGLLKYCSNLKNIQIPFNMTENGSQWLHKNYPKLEHISAPNSFGLTKEDWKTFFELNPNIRRFKCDHQFLLEYKDWLLATNTQIVSLEIKNGYYNKVLPPCSLLNKLYDRGFYKKLRLSIWQPDENFMDEICKLRGIEMMVLRFLREEFDFPIMNEVREMFLCGISVNFQVLMRKFPNVERINLWNGTVDQMMTLIRWSTNLRDLKAVCFEAFGLRSKTQPLNLEALEKEREKLAGASKVTVYVEDDIYLATKWANDGRDFKLIEIKRYDSGVFHDHSS